MDCIVWRGTYAKSGVALRDGLEVQLVGSFDVYAGTGRLSFVARSLSVAGEGLLRQQVAELARRLEREGLMADARKRPIPRFCTRVAVVTSMSGSVIDDVKRTLRRRNPLVEIQVAGCSVQGPGAPESIIHALSVAASAHPDAILLVRGGGSFEDLMTFNDESLARAVAACPVPVVCGIGHEPDTSICDMVSDRRCSTPTAAAESVAPAMDEIEAQISDRSDRLVRALSREVEARSAMLDSSSRAARRAMDAYLAGKESGVAALASRRCLVDPTSMIDDRTNDLLLIEQRLHDAIPRSLGRTRRLLDDDGIRLAEVGGRMLRPYVAVVGKAAAELDALSPLKVLGRGYAIARDSAGHVVSHASDVHEGDGLDVLLGSGHVLATVTASIGVAEETDGAVADTPQDTKSDARPSTSPEGR
jgi:exodeoxyribonuclease VII large subunit